MINIGICGYGNLGKGVEKVLKYNKDMKLKAIFSRRKIKTDVPLIGLEEIEKLKDEIDVVIMCGGSLKDLEIQVPMFAKIYNTVDSFDTHKKIPEYYKKINEINRKNNTVSLVSGGWDPGLFSIFRLYIESILPEGKSHTFWGKGVSQGHSDAIRRIEGVKNAVQYTIPKNEIVEKIKFGANYTFTPKQMHTRECYVVTEDGFDKLVIEEKIKNMENYFKGYDTNVYFISEEELNKKHNKMPHGGIVIGNSNVINENNQNMEFSLKLDSNPEFTASVLIAYARAVYKLSKAKDYGAKTVFDIPPKLLSQNAYKEIIEKLL